MKKGQVTIFMILGLSILMAFIFVIMLNVWLVEVMAVQESDEISFQECVEGSLIVDFLRIENQGSGNAEGKVYVGSEPTLYSDNEAIPLLVDSGSVIDSGYIFDSSGLILERGVDYLHFILKGNQNTDDVEIMDFIVSLEGAQIQMYSEDEDYPLEKQGDGIYEDNPIQDEVIIDLEENTIEAYIRVSTNSDGFYLYYSCGSDEE